MDARSSRKHAVPRWSDLVAPLLLLAAVGCNRGATEVSPVRRDILEAVFATGHLAMEDEYLVAPNQESFLAEVLVRPGDHVKVGDPLFRLSSPVKSSELATARAQHQEALRKAEPSSPSIVALQAQIAQATDQLEIERKNVKRYTVLAPSGAAAQADVDAAQLRFESARSNLSVLTQSLADMRNELALNVRVSANQLRIAESQQDDHLVKAAQAGQVLEVFKEQGDLARKGEVLARIGGGGFLAMLFVAEEDVRLVRLGQAVKIGLNTDKTRVFEGRITRIYPSFDAASQSFKLEASIDAGGEPLYAGTQLQANVVVALRENALAVPLHALSENGQVTLAGGEVVAVTIGVRSGNWVEVTSGISDSDRIVVRGARP